jgi:hypothetical protein
MTANTFANTSLTPDPDPYEGFPEEEWHQQEGRTPVEDCKPVPDLPVRDPKMFPGRCEKCGEYHFYRHFYEMSWLDEL